MPNENLLQQVLAENEALRHRLDEAEEVLDALQSGEVDAVVVTTAAGQQVFTLQGADHPYRVLVESMNEGAATLGFNGTILYCNSRLAAMLRLPLDRLIGSRFDRYVAPPDTSDFLTMIQRCQKEHCKMELRLAASDGSWIPALFSCRKLEQEGVQGISAVITDVSEKKRNDEIIASGNLANSIIEQAGEVIVVCNEQGTVIRASGLASGLFGNSPVGTHFDEVCRVREGESDRYFSVTHPLNGGITRNEEVRLEIDGNLPLYFVLNAGPLTERHGRVIGCVVTLTDVTSSKLAERALQRAHEELEQRVAERTRDLANTVRQLHEKEHMLLQQSRLAAMGEMISNIAHQWRQPLNALGLVVQELPELHSVGQLNDENLNESVQTAMLLVQHMSRTIDDFRNFFKPDKEKVEFRLSQVVNNAVKLIEASFDSRQIGIELHYQQDPTVFGYPNEYSQVILNILNNAKDAVEARRTPDPQVVITTAAQAGRSVITITDNAGGIPEEIIFKVFDPHFTTKDTQGTGIGLFMAKNIIEKNMNGKLSVRNTGRGAEFRIEV